MAWNPTDPGDIPWSPAASSAIAWGTDEPGEIGWTPQADGAQAWSPDEPGGVEWGPASMSPSDVALITALWTFDRDPAAPFAVAAGSAKVDNLDADYLDGQHGTYYLDWDNFTDTPTTLAGYGITDAYTKVASDARFLGIGATAADSALLDGENAAHYHAWGNLTGVPTTVAGYGITDAYTKTEADAAFLGIADQAADSALLDGQAAAYYLAWGNLTGVPASFTPSAHAASHVGGQSDEVDHDTLLNYAVGQHRVINDAGTGATDLWSASKISTTVGLYLPLAGGTMTGDITMATGGWIGIGATSAHVEFDGARLVKVNYCNQLQMNGDTSGLAYRYTYNANEGAGAGASSYIYTKGGGDAVVQMAVSDGATIWAAGVDNSDSDSYKIHNAFALADTSLFELTTAGALTLASGLTLGGTLLMGANGIGNDNPIMTFGAGANGSTTVTGHVLLGTTYQVQFRDPQLGLGSSADGQLDIFADGTVAISGACTMDTSLVLDSGASLASITIQSNVAGAGAVMYWKDTGSGAWWRFLMMGTDDATTAEDFFLMRYTGSSYKEWLRCDVSAGALVLFDNPGLRRDFRVEGSGATHLLFTDGSEGRVGINTSAPAVTFEITGTARMNGTGQWQFNTSAFNMYSDGTNLIATSSGDFDVACAAQKTLELQTAVWDDINFGTGQGQLPTASIPGVVTFTDNAGADTGIATRGFAVGESLSWTTEYTHDCKVDADFYFHVHFQCDDAPTGTDYVKWQIEYTITADDATCAATTTITQEIAVDTQYEQQRATFAVTSGTFGPDSQIKVKLSRVAAAGDAYAGEAKLCTFGIHVQKNTLGSRQEAIK